MWNDIKNNVQQAVKRSISNGLNNNKIILALTTNGLTDWNLNYFLDQVIDLDLGGLFIWRYDNISQNHFEIIKTRLGK